MYEVVLILNPCAENKNNTPITKQLATCMLHLQMFKNKNKIKIQNTNRKWLHCTMWPHSGAMQKPHCDFCCQKLTKFSLNSTILTGTNASMLIGYNVYYSVHSWHKTYFGRLSLGDFGPAVPIYRRGKTLSKRDTSPLLRSCYSPSHQHGQSIFFGGCCQSSC